MVGAAPSAAHSSLSPLGLVADCLPVLHLHYPDTAQDLVARLSAPAPLAPCLRAACRASEELQAAGWNPPDWPQLLRGQQSTPPAFHGPSSALRGWQCEAAHTVLAHCQAVLLGGLDPAGQAMLHSQSGSFASRSFTTVPTCPALAYSSDLFRVLLLRRLRLPPSPRGGGSPASEGCHG